VILKKESYKENIVNMRIFSKDSHGYSEQYDNINKNDTNGDTGTIRTFKQINEGNRVK